MISKFDYGYDAQGQITSWTQQTDTSDPQNWTMGYDQEGKLLTVNVKDTVTSAVLHQYAYLYDAAGNRTSEQIDGNVVGSSYNNLNQLTGQSGGGKMVFSGTLSEPAVVTVAGNPATSGYYSTNFTGIAPVTAGTNNVPIVAHDVNGNTGTNTYQVVVQPASSGYSYDLNGNLLSDGNRTFQWDAKDQMTAIIYNTGPNAGNHTEFTYNGAGERVKIVEATGTTVGSGTVTSTKQFVWAGGLAEERDGSNNVTKRFFSQGEQIGGTNYFYTTDHVGSVREMMASDGKTIATRYSYDPYGRRTKVSGTLDSDFGFTGHYWHVNSGLYLAPYRAYDPNLGRWISRDPSGEGSDQDLYRYCADNPVCRADPNGDISIYVIAIGGLAKGGYDGYQAYREGASWQQIGVRTLNGTAAGVLGTTAASLVQDTTGYAPGSIAVGVATTEVYDKWANHEPVNWNEIDKSIVAATAFAGLTKLLGDIPEETSEAVSDTLSNIYDSLTSENNAPKSPAQNPYYIPSFDQCMEMPTVTPTNNDSATPVAPTTLLPGGLRP